MLHNLIWRQIEKRFIFFPTRNVETTPEDAGVAFEEVIFPTDGGLQLHGWYVPGPSNTTWLWFHGNAGNIGHRVSELALLHSVVGMNLLIFDYQGYGKSEGRPSEQGTYRDARAALGYLQKRMGAESPGLSSQKIVFFGHSLGCAIATELAIGYPPAGLVLVSAFTSVGDMSRLAIPWLPVGWLIGRHYNSLARISRLTCPLLVLHGQQDSLVPISQGEQLYDAATSSKKFQSLPDAGHNDTFIEGGEAYWDALVKFEASLANPDSKVS